MILTLIGLILSFVGTFAIIFDNIYRGQINLKGYYLIFRGRLWNYNINYKLIKRKFKPIEIRFLIYIILILIGFLFQIIGLTC